MKIRKINRAHIVAAMALSAAVLFAGCGSDTAEEAQAGPNATGEVQTEINTTGEAQTELDATEEAQTEPGAAGEKISDDKDLVKENDIKEENQGKDTANGSDAADNQKAAPGGTDIYDSVLAQYSDMVQNNFYTDLRDSDDYESCFGEDIGLEIRTHEQGIYCAFYDIDGNGTMELIVAGEENGVSSPAFSPWNYDLYGYDGTRVVHIFPEMEFGYRTNFTLYENGVIEVFYSGSAAESGVDFYKIGSDGFTPELIDSFASVGHLEGDAPVFVYSQNGNEITEEEYKASIQSYEVTLTTALDWTQIQ